MTSNAPGECCVAGSRHNGIPEGELKIINGVNTYITTIPKRRHEGKVLILLSDIFGISANAQLLADEFARSGYLTVVPDLFQKDPISSSDFDSGKTDMSSWLAKHTPERTDPIVARTINYVREDLGAEMIGAVGYCFGAKYVCRFLKAGGIDVGYVAHPAYVTREDLSSVAGPISISTAAVDDIFPATLRYESESILAKANQPWQMNIFSNVSHGFAVRADLTQKRQRFAKEQAFSQAVSWFVNYL